jgi:hypothetical protein
MRSKQTGNTRLYALAIAAVLAFSGAASSPAEGEEYGPINLLKTMKTPFGAAEQGSGPGDTTGAMKLTRSNSPSRGLASRLLQSRLYLPGRMVLGKPAELVVKGKPGQYVALAMAEKNSGAKPIYGQELRLGSDRKLVAVGQIPETGVLSMIIETPIQGDLIGERWFFEAALWTRPDFSDLELAQSVPADATGAAEADKANGVLVAADIEQKKGIRIVPDTTPPMLRNANKPFALDSGRP